MLMHCPKISLVTPSFNQAQYIEQTICSVLDQNYPNLEYIIIDGGSTDETISIIKKYEKHLSYWVSEPDKGQTDAINKGLAKCTGEIFNWINSDDYYEPGTFNKLANYFSDNRVDVVCGKEWGFEDRQPEKRTLHKGTIIGKDLFETVRIGIIDQPCTFFRKEKLKDFFPLYHSLRYVMDRQLWWQYLLKYGQKNILQVEDIFTNFRYHNSSKSISEGSYFEHEFDLLKHSLFRQLIAPQILLDQLHLSSESLPIHWPVQSGQRESILAAFAAYYAERHYVRKNRTELRTLISLLRQWKGLNLAGKEWKWWMVAHGLPKPAFTLLERRVQR